MVAGIAYEYIRFTAKNMHSPIVRALITPSLMLQKLTTREPDDSMLEVAIASLSTVLAKEGVVVQEEVREREGQLSVVGG